MAHNRDLGNFGQFSVIARPRQQTSSALSTYDIITKIAKELEPYKCICNVSFCSPNFMIHLPTLELQLQILSCKTFSVPDYILDIVPWSAEYASFELPWVIKTSIEDAFTDCSDIYIKVADCVHNSAAVAAFSHLMIAELKEYYQTRLEAFTSCEQTSKEMCSIARLFSDEVHKAINHVYQKTREYNSTPPQGFLSYLITFGDDLKNEEWFIDEEIFSLTNNLNDLNGSHKSAMNFAQFSASKLNGELAIPVATVGLLKTIAKAVVQHIYGTAVSIVTEMDYTATFWTEIWCERFRYEYKTSPPATYEEAETRSIYRFLKYISNIHGYIIDDHSSGTLSTMICHTNSLNVSISELHLCVEKIAKMIETVSENINQSHRQISVHLSQRAIAPLNFMVDDLLTLLDHYSTAANNGLQNFQQKKKAFRAIRFASVYPSKPDKR